MESGSKRQRTGTAQFSSGQLLSNGELSRLIHTVGHEIGNPLTSIISLGTIIQRFSAPEETSGALEPEKLISYSSSMITEAWRIGTLSERLVQLLSDRVGNRIDADIADAINKAAKKVRTRSTLESDDLIIRFEQNAPKTAFIDFDQLVAVLFEFLDNAYRIGLEASQNRDELEDIPLVVISSGSDNRAVKISVSNKSIRSLGDDIESLFQPFTVVQQEEKHVGLGLCTSAAIVDRIDGTLVLREENCDGHFLITIEATLPTSSTITDSKTDSQSSETSLARTAPTNSTVLVVEDEATVSSAIVKILEVGFTAASKLNCICLSGEEAVDYITSGKHFDAMLCDLNLANMSGRHVLNTLTESRPDELTKFMFLTGDQARKETQTYLSSTGRPFLHKPFEPEELINSVSELLNSSEKN